MNSHIQVSLPLPEERLLQTAAELQKTYPEMPRAEALSRAKTAIEFDRQRRIAAYQRQPVQGESVRPGDGRRPAAVDPAQSGIVKRAERMAADDAAKKAAESARHSENLARAQLLGQAS